MDELESQLAGFEEDMRASAVAAGCSFVDDRVGLIPEDPPSAEVIPTSDTSRHWLAVYDEIKRQIETLPEGDFREIVLNADYDIDEETDTVRVRGGEVELGTWPMAVFAEWVRRYYQAAG